jgi:hypothetical protein
MVSTYPSRHLRSGRLRQRSQLACRRRSIADGPNEMGVATVGAREGVPIERAGGPLDAARRSLAGTDEGDVQQQLVHTLRNRRQR